MKCPIMLHFIMVFTVYQGMHLGVTSLFSFFSGLGYIVGANVAAAFHAWQYALRVSHLRIFTFYAPKGTLGGI